MDYKQIAVINERKLKAKNEELKAKVEQLQNQKEQVEEIRDEIDKLKEYSMSALEDKSDDKLIKLVKGDYDDLIDLRNRIEYECEHIYEEDHITCDHILDYIELLYAILKIMKEQKGEN